PDSIPLPRPAYRKAMTVSDRKDRWTDRLALLSELLHPQSNRWDGLHALLAELAPAFDYASLDFGWPVSPKSEVVASSKPASEPISVSPELIEKIQGKSEGVLLDPQVIPRRIAVVRILQRPPGILFA